MTTHTTSVEPPEIDAPPTAADRINAAVDTLTAHVAEGRDWAATCLPATTRYLAIKDLRDLARDLDKACTAALTEAEAEVLEWMADNATDRWRNPATGQGVHIRHEIRASVLAANRPQAVAALTEIGAGALVEQTVNANTLSAWVREQIDSAVRGALDAEAHDAANAIEADPALALPEPLRPYVQIAALTKIGTTKARKS